MIVSSRRKPDDGGQPAGVVDYPGFDVDHCIGYGGGQLSWNLAVIRPMASERS